MILAIDTSTDQASVALVEGDALLAEVTWVAPGNHSRRLSGAIGYLLELAGAAQSDLSAIAVAIGPGSFSGVRVGLSAAKGLALGLGIPLVGVATLDVIALPALALSSQALSLMPAGRGLVFAALFENEHGIPHRAGEYLLISLSDAADLAGERTLLVGSAAAEVADVALAEGKRLRVLAPTLSVRRAAHLAELGRFRLERGVQDSLADLEPLYLRKSSAEEKRGPRPEESV